MILLSAIANITSNLDVISQQDGKGISSHVKLKEEALECLANLVQKAPINEYKNMFDSPNCDILIGYLMNILCRLAKDDKSVSVRIKSLRSMNVLIHRLSTHHSNGYSNDHCSIGALISSLPGVISTLIRLIMSDSKLNHKFIVLSVQNLKDFIEATFQPCHHEAHSSVENNITTSKLAGEYLDEVCNNLATRISILFRYVMNNYQSLHLDVKVEVLNLAITMLNDTKNELVSRVVPSITRYLAFILSTLETSLDICAKYRESVNTLVKSINLNLDQKDDLNTPILECLFKVLDDLAENAFQMLHCERESNLAILAGTVQILPPKTLMIFLEIPHRREEVVDLFTKLTEFCNQQALLFLTEQSIGDQTLEVRGERIYTSEKRFAHISDYEVKLICNTCRYIGGRADWSFLNDLLRSELMDFSNPSKLYLANQVMVGILDRNLTKIETNRFTSSVLDMYITRIQDCYLEATMKSSREISLKRVLTIVVAIETLAVIMEIHTKYIGEGEPSRAILIKDVLCPLLNWSASKSRAISEASLNALIKIGLIYGHRSTQSLIASYIDYIVDGVAHMLHNFSCNPDVTNVLAITFKLSSAETFYYFKDIYERVFKLLEAYHYTDRSKSIALLFYRTLTVIHDWECLNNLDRGHRLVDEEVPLKCEASIRTILEQIDFDLRLKKLRDHRREALAIIEKMNDVQLEEGKIEGKLEQDLNDGTISMESEKVNNGGETSEQPSEQTNYTHTQLLTEKIMKHCIGLISSDFDETKILALKTASIGFRILKANDDILLPLVHQLWSPLMSRLTGDYNRNLEVNLCAFECLVTMASQSKDFIKSRTTESLIPRLCLFLEAQAKCSRGKKEYEPYCMTMVYKSQLKLLANIGPLAYHIGLAYTSLWPVIKVALLYLDHTQIPSLREAARTSLHFLIALDADCVWYFAKQKNHLEELPFELIYELA